MGTSLPVLTGRSAVDGARCSVVALTPSRIDAPRPRPGQRAARSPRDRDGLDLVAAGDLLHRFHPRDDLAEVGVLVVQPLGRLGADEELGVVADPDVPAAGDADGADGEG